MQSLKPSSQKADSLPSCSPLEFAQWFADEMLCHNRSVRAFFDDGVADYQAKLRREVYSPALLSRHRRYRDQRAKAAFAGDKKRRRNFLRNAVRDLRRPQRRKDAEITHKLIARVEAYRNRRVSKLVRTMAGLEPQSQIEFIYRKICQIGLPHPNSLRDFRDEIESEFLGYLSRVVNNLTKCLAEAARAGKRNKGLWTLPALLDWARKNPEKVPQDLKEEIRRRTSIIQLHGRSSRGVDGATESVWNRRMAVGVGDDHFHGDNKLRWHRFKILIAWAHKGTDKNRLLGSLDNLFTAGRFEILWEFIHELLQELLPKRLDNSWPEANDLSIAERIQKAVPSSIVDTAEMRKKVNQARADLKIVWEVIKASHELQNSLLCLALVPANAFRKALREWLDYRAEMLNPKSTWHLDDQLLGRREELADLKPKEIACKLLEATDRTDNPSNLARDIPRRQRLLGLPAVRFRKPRSSK